jgi:transcriptional regulator with XRE-family HTH domain
MDVEIENAGLLVKKMREAKGLTLRELGVLTGVNQSNIAKMEKDRIPLPLKKLQLFGEVMGYNMRITASKK